MAQQSLILFGNVVRLERERAGLSQERLADLAGLHRTYVGGIERGERNIGLLNLVKVAKALRVPASKLVASVDGVAS